MDAGAAADEGNRSLTLCGTGVRTAGLPGAHSSSGSSSTTVHTSPTDGTFMLRVSAIRT